jgi:hypothetical protein
MVQLTFNTQGPVASLFVINFELMVYFRCNVTAADGLLHLVNLDRSRGAMG